MDINLLLSLPVTAVGYLLVPVLYSIFTRKDIGRNKRIMIIVLNAIAIFSLFTWIKYLGNGVLSEGNVGAAFVWSFAGYYISKEVQSKHQVKAAFDSDVSVVILPKQKPYWFFEIPLFIMMCFSVIIVLFSTKLGIYMFKVEFDGKDNLPADFSASMVSQFSNSVMLAAFMVLIMCIFGIILHTIKINK